MKIIAIGDSHTHLFHEKIPVFSPGAITAKNFSTDTNPLKIKINDFIESSVNSYETVILCLGEIDIRAHYWRDIPIYESRGVNTDRYISTLVNQFVDAIIKFKNEYKIKSILIWGVPPASSQNRGERNYFVTGMGAYNPELPHVGSQSTRNIITHKFNRYIIKALKNNAEFGIKFLTAFYNFVDDDFQTIANNLSDGVHYDPDFSETAFNLILKTIEKPDLVTCDASIFRLDEKEITFELQQLTSPSEINFDVWIENIIDLEFQVPLRNIPMRIESENKFISLIPAPTVRHHNNLPYKTLCLAIKKMSKLDKMIFNSLSNSLNVEQSDLNYESGMMVTKNWDSLNQMNIIFNLERDFSVQFDVSEFEKLTTFKQIKDVLIIRGLENN
jgi:acyl carrier protein